MCTWGDRFGRCEVFAATFSAVSWCLVCFFIVWVGGVILCFIMVHYRDPAPVVCFNFSLFYELIQRDPTPCFVYPFAHFLVCISVWFGRLRFFCLFAGCRKWLVPCRKLRILWGRWWLPAADRLSQRQWPRKNVSKRSPVERTRRDSYCMRSVVRMISLPWFRGKIVPDREGFGYVLRRRGACAK